MFRANGLRPRAWNESNGFEPEGCPQSADEQNAPKLGGSKLGSRACNERAIQAGQATGSGAPLQSPCCKAEAISTGRAIEWNTLIIFELSVEPEVQRHLDNP